MAAIYQLLAIGPFQFQLFQLFFFSRCARSINLVDLSPLGDCPGAGTENLVDFSKVSLAARDGLVYAGAGLCSPAARNP